MPRSIHSLGGVLAPVVTTFDAASGALAMAPFADNIRAHFALGLSGVLVAGSSGEAPLLDETERRRLIEAARDVVPDDRWLLAGIGGESTALTVQRARGAAERGADAVLVVSPHYFANAMTAAALSAHFRRVADASPVPVLLYNIPKYAHLTLEPSLVRELSSHENIVGMKDSSGDLTLLRGYLASQSDGFTVLTGHGGSIAPAVELGARGGILAVALFAGALSLEAYRAAAAGDAARAREAQERLVPLAREIVSVQGIAGIKAAMDAVGLHGGPVRAPLLPLAQAARDQVAALLEAADLAHAA